MDSRPGRTPAVSTPDRPAALASVAVESEIPTAVAKRIAKAIESSRSEGTRRTHAAGWRRFAGFCAREGHTALPAHPVTVAAYLVDAADTRTESGERAYAVATFGTWIAAINHQHRTTGHLSPSARELVTATLSGIRREYAAAGDRPRTPRDPLLVDDIKVLVSTARQRCRGWADDCSGRQNRSARTSAVGECPERQPEHRYSGPLPRAAILAPHRCPGQRSTRPSAVAPSTPAVTPLHSPSSVGTLFARGSSPKAPGTAPTDPRSHVRPAMPASIRSRSTAANTRPSSGTRLPRSGCRSPVIAQFHNPHD